MDTKPLPMAMLFRIAGLTLILTAWIALMSGCSQGFAKADRVVRAEEGQLTTMEVNGLNETTHEVAPDAEVVLDGRPAALKELASGDAVKLTTENRDGTEVIKKIDARSKEKVEADMPTTNPLIDQPARSVRPPSDQPFPGAPQESPELNAPNSQAPRPEADRSNDSENGTTQEANQASDESIAGDSLAEEPFSGKISSLGDNQFVIKDGDMEHTFTVNDDTKYTLDGNEATFDDLEADHSVNVTADKEGGNDIAKMVDATSSGDSIQ